MNYLQVSFSSCFFRFCSFGLCKLYGGIYDRYYHAAWLCACCAYCFASHSYVHMSNDRFMHLCDVIAFVALLLVAFAALFFGNLHYQADLYQETHFGVLP